MAEKSNKLGKNLIVERKQEADERKQAVVSVMSAIEKQYGKGSIMKMGERVVMNVEAISTGVLTLDAALGIGGIPRGRVIEIYGPESSGKTTVALNIIAQAQKSGGEAAFIDAEHALDPVYAAKLGVDVDNLLISQPDTGEQALDIAEALVRCGAIDVIVIDSVAALVPKAEIEGTMGEAHVGLLARLMSQALRKLTAITNRSGTAVIFINQLREKVGNPYGNPETTTGGRALKFFSSVRLDVRRSEVLKNGTELIGARTKVKVVKNKVAPPFHEAEFDIIYGEGISKEGNILDVAVDLDVIQKSGSWFAYDGQKLGQGRDNVRKYMIENPEFTAEIDKKIRDLMQNSNASFPEKKNNAKENAAEMENSAEESIVEVTENNVDGLTE